MAQPRSGERIQPTAQAVGASVCRPASPEGRKKIQQVPIKERNPEQIKPSAPRPAPRAQPQSSPTTAPLHPRAASSRPTETARATDAEYFPAAIDPPRKISTGRNSRNSAMPNPATAARISSNETSSPNTNEKSRSTAGYFPSGANFTVRSPVLYNCSRSISARNTSCRSLRAAATSGWICPN